jgi:hypothetical protein
MEDHEVIRRLLNESGELRYGKTSLRVHGRALRLVLWLIQHQKRINETAPLTGQIWLTWKDLARDSMSGDLRTTL